MMITAEVTPSMSLTDNSTVGIGLETGSTGNGYELAFFNDSSSFGVELENGTTTFDASLYDSFGSRLIPGKAYGMQLMVLHEPDGTDSVFGMVWPWFQSDGKTQSGMPQYWNMFVGGQTHALGSPSLDGGSSGNATASFANIAVSTATTPALPLINMGTAYTGSVTGNTLTGGTLMFSYGPWQITGNTYDGAVAGTYVDAAFSFFTGHNRNLSGNTVEQLSPYGKTVRLLSIGNGESWGSNDVISDNTVVDSEGMGTRPGDWGWDQNVGIYDGTNQAEFILFEIVLHRLRGNPVHALRRWQGIDDPLCTRGCPLDGRRRVDPQRTRRWPVVPGRPGDPVGVCFEPLLHGAHGLTAPSALGRQLRDLDRRRVCQRNHRQHNPGPGKHDRHPRQ